MDPPCNVEFRLQPIPRKSNKFCLSGFLRSHYKEFGISKKLICEYDDFIDFSEILNKNFDVKSNLQHGLLTQSFRLHALFHTTHPLIDKIKLYTQLVFQIAQNPCMDTLFDSDVLFGKIVEYEVIKNRFRRS